MNYIVLDLEWNQSPGGKKTEHAPLPFEIIEIGAVKLNANKEILDEFHRLIRPVVYKKLHHQIQRVLKKTAEDFNNGTTFSQAILDFFQWCGEDYRICTWGPMDLPELQRNMLYYQIPLSLLERPLLYYDVQKLFSIAYEDRKTRRTLEFAVDFLNICKTEEFHGALCDARYTALVLQHLERSLIQNNYSIDCFIPPQSKKEEIYAVFSTYSKYISREFDSREKALADREVTSTRCYLCGKPAKKKIRWFSCNNKHYYCQSYCEHHGYLKGKLNIKTSENGKIFMVKILKLVSLEEAMKIKEKQEELRKKRRAKRKQKKQEKKHGNI